MDGERRHPRPATRVANHWVANWGRWIRVQSLAALGLTGMALVQGRVAAYSALFGSLCAFLPTVIFTGMLAARVGADSGEFLKRAALAETVKLLLTGVLCATVFIVIEPLAAGWFFLGMIGVLLAGWLGLIFVD